MVVTGDEAKRDLVASDRDSTAMVDAELRSLMSNPRLREKLQRLVAKTTPTEGSGSPASSTPSEDTVVAPRPPLATEAAVEAVPPIAERARADLAAAAADATEVSGAVGAPAREAVPKDALADYEEEGAPSDRGCDGRVKALVDHSHL